MRKPTAFHLIAWVGVPFAFAVFVGLSYSLALRSGALPFLAGNELKWRLAFAVALAIGGTCVAIANRADQFWAVVGPILYVVAMSAAFFVIQLSVACANGDCL